MGDAGSMQVTIISKICRCAAFNTRYQHLLNISVSETKLLYINRDQENGQQVNHFPSGKKRNGGKKQETLTVIRKKYTWRGRKKGARLAKLGESNPTIFQTLPPYVTSVFRQNHNTSLKIPATLKHAHTLIDVY